MSAGVRNGSAPGHQPMCILSISLQPYSRALVVSGLEKVSGHLTTGCRLLSIEDDRGRFGMAEVKECVYSRYLDSCVDFITNMCFSIHQKDQGTCADSIANTQQMSDVEFFAYLTPRDF